MSQDEETEKESHPTVNAVGNDAAVATPDNRPPPIAVEMDSKGTLSSEEDQKPTPGSTSSSHPYLSSASSTTASPFMNTIAYRKDEHPPTTTPFVSMMVNYPYDSDGSDGRYVWMFLFTTIHNHHLTLFFHSTALFSLLIRDDSR